MPAQFTRRLAGIRFEDRPPELPEKLPRMDIAVFVGFAASGPLQRPVAVEDSAHFAEIFGGDLPLAWDVERSAPGYALLPPAVRMFFQNGGRRCWIVRVAEQPESSVFALPGLARIAGDDLAGAFARARAPGSWADDLLASTALSARAFEVHAWDPAFTWVDVRLALRETLRAGDLLRLTEERWQQEIFLQVVAAAPALDSVPEALPGAWRVNVRPLGCLEPVDPQAIGESDWTISWTRTPDAAAHPPTWPGRHEPPTPASPPEVEPSSELFELRVPRGFAPGISSLLRLDAADSPPQTLWLVVDDFLLPDPASPDSLGLVRGRAFHWQKSPPIVPADTEVAGQKLTFELRVRMGESEARVLPDLGFAAAHPRVWDALPDDDQFFAGPDRATALRKAEATGFAGLWEEAAEPRFPLAGSDTGAAFIPVGMNALPTVWTGARFRGKTALERDGLSSYSPGLFIDPRLLLSDAVTLQSEADFVRYQLADDGQLTGMHAALGIEEATLIALPDALHRGWKPASPSEPPPPKPSAPLPHPAWWHFLDCNPPAPPPENASAPQRGHFIECGLPFPSAPVLKWQPLESGDSESPLASTAAGPFVLEWDGPAGGGRFVLEEAVLPDFADVTEPLWSGPTQHYTVRSRTPGNYYYRVRVEVGGETSDWSNGVVVPVRAAGGWEVSREAFDCRLLVDVHRALLRLCCARADLFALLAVPEEYREDETLAHVRELKAPFVHPGPRRPLPLNAGEANAFSYAALYHPWLTLRDHSGALRILPPDGAAAGIMARRTLARGAWLAPANESFAEVLALTPAIDPGRQLELLLAQINLIRGEPQGVIALNADTLSDDPDLRPINVRRLLILLRRAALKLGASYVFEVNDASLRRIVQHAFESMLHRLFVGGAFAGATADTSYRVVTDDSLNPPASVEQGRFRIDLKVAPSLPMSFLTVRLAQLGERSTATEIR